MTDQKKEKCRATLCECGEDYTSCECLTRECPHCYTLLSREPHEEWLPCCHECACAELLKRGQREEKLVECLKDCKTCLSHLDPIMGFEKAVLRIATDLLKELGYE